MGRVDVMDDAIELVISGFILGVMVSVLVSIVVFDSAATWKSEAVKHGAAEYYLDKYHNKQFRWLDEEKK